MTNIVQARNTVSGQVGPVPESYLTHPHFSKQLELVKEGAKSTVPALHTPRNTDGDKLNDKAEKAKAPSDK